MSFKNWSLKVKLVMLVLFAIFILGAGGWFSMSQLKGYYRKEVISNYGGHSTVLGEKIAAQFYERYGDIQIFATDGVVMGLNSAEMPQRLDTFVEKYGIYDVVLVVDKNGNYLSSNTKDAGGKSINRSALEKMNYQNEPWFKAVISGNYTEDKKLGYAGTYFEEPHFDKITRLAVGEQRAMTSFSSVIKNKHGDVVGVISNRTSSRWFDQELQTMYDQIVSSGNEELNISLINKEGLVISEILPDANDGKKTPQYSEKRFLKYNMKNDLKGAVEDLLQGRSGSREEYDPQDQDNNVVGYSYISNSKWPAGIGWGVMVHGSSSETLKANISSERNFYIIFGISGLLALSLSIYLSLALSKELSGLSVVLGKNSEDVSDAANQIASSSVQLSASATKQAAALQETAAAVDEISAMVSKNADAANSSKESSAQSRDAALKGRQIVDNMIQAISEINDSNTQVSQQVEQSNAQLSEITQLINDIGAKTKVINEIVFQTKLLSFNASVEAARAGEAGKGFAVVAEEVGNLAQMSGNAAKEITDLLQESVRKVETIVNSSKEKIEVLVNQASEKVKTGGERAMECNQALDEILASVSSVDALVSEIAVASQEQATGIAEIAKAVSQMEEVTQETSEVASTSSVAAGQLSSQSLELKSVVGSLVLMVDGAGKGGSGGSPAESVSSKSSQSSTSGAADKKIGKKLTSKGAVFPRAEDIQDEPEASGKGSAKAA